MWVPLLYSESIRSTADNLAFCDSCLKRRGGQSCGTEPLIYGVCANSGWLMSELLAGENPHVQCQKW